MSLFEFLITLSAMGYIASSLLLYDDLTCFFYFSFFFFKKTLVFLIFRENKDPQIPVEFK